MGVDDFGIENFRKRIFSNNKAATYENQQYVVNACAFWYQKHNTNFGDNVILKHKFRILVFFSKNAKQSR